MKLLSAPARRPYRKTRGHLYSTALLLTLWVCFSAQASSLSKSEPSIEFSAQDVINIVVDALETNDAKDSGIVIVFRFASPRNKASTGPLSRFTQMIKLGFPEMLNHIGARFDPIEIHDDIAVQAVWLRTDNGAEYGYAFKLGKQQEGAFKGMWMTDAVFPLGQSQNSGLGI